MKLNQLTKWQGTTNRKDFLLWGLILFTVKYNLDRLIALAFDKVWFISDYFIQADKMSMGELTEDDRIFYLVLLVQSLPFIWFGTVLCIKRLRSANLQPWFVLLFFIPFLNFLLFILLAALPEKQEKGEPNKSFLSRLIPTSKYGSAFFAIGTVLIVSLLFTTVFINQLNEYGWSLFVGIPFFLGFGSVLIYGHHRKLSYRDAMKVMGVSILFFNLLLFLLAYEGVICITMAFPIVLVIAWIGASIGYAIHECKQEVSLNVLSAPLVFVILMGAIEANDNPTPPLIALETEIEVAASKQEVWNELVAFSHIAEPTEYLFKTGIAYPTHAEIEGTGVGAIRHCNFTTGSFVEPITTWDEPNLLAFSVLVQPPPMVEWSLYENLNIEHLHGYFASEKGQFLLKELKNGNTRLVGTTWYRHNIWPTMYWSIWSNYILHQIHYRVLNHIKAEAESNES